MVSTLTNACEWLVQQQEQHSIHQAMAVIINSNVYVPNDDTKLHDVLKMAYRTYCHSVTHTEIRFSKHTLTNGKNFFNRRY